MDQMEVSQEDNSPTIHDLRVSGEMCCYLTLYPDIDTLSNSHQILLIDHKETADSHIMYLHQVIKKYWTNFCNHV